MAGNVVTTGSFSPFDRSMMGFQAGIASGVLGTGLLLALTSFKLPLVCPLRLITGVPCPMCGMTTGSVAFLRGDLRGSLAANPFSVVFLPALLAFLADRVRRFLRGLPTRPWRPQTRKTLMRLAIAGATASWVYQLFRFDIF